MAQWMQDLGQPPWLAAEVVRVLRAHQIDRITAVQEYVLVMGAFDEVPPALEEAGIIVDPSEGPVY